MMLGAKKGGSGGGGRDFVPGRGYAIAYSLMFCCFAAKAPLDR